ncbi:MAG: hypothetical protein HN383_01930, partial [Verrucomicrobia bacterium]|nr:hypothetical protein [Verrucomicrobiota bacterium]
MSNGHQSHTSLTNQSFFAAIMRRRAWPVVLFAILSFGFMAGPALGTANYVYHEQDGTSDNPAGHDYDGATDGASYLGRTTVYAGEYLGVRVKVQYQGYVDTTKLWYTTDGSTPTVAGGTEVSLNWEADGTGDPVPQVWGKTDAIPPQTVGTVINYIIASYHSGGGDWIYANGGDDTLHNEDTEATVFSTTVVEPTVPYSEDFSYDDGVDLDGVKGWGVETTTGSVIATNATAQLIDATLTNAFSDAQTSVTIAFALQPQFSDDAPTIPDDATYAFYVKTNGLITAYHGTTPSNLTHTALSESSFTNIEIDVDYVWSEWSLRVGATEVATDFPFYSSSNSAFKELVFIESSTNASYIDTVDVQVGPTPPTTTTAAATTTTAAATTTTTPATTTTVAATTTTAAATTTTAAATTTTV